MLRNHHTLDEVFKQYHDCIAALDGRGLMVLIGKYKRLPDYLHYGNNVIGVLARERNHASLDWLRNVFCADYQMYLDFSHAAFEYARQGLEERFQPLIDLSDESRGEVLRGLAIGGHHHLVEQYVRHGNARDTANLLFGYAAAGNDVKVRQWHLVNNNELAICSGHAFAGHIEAVEHYHQRQPQYEYHWICMNEYARGGWYEAVEAEALRQVDGAETMPCIKFDVACALIRHGYKDRAEYFQTYHYSENSYVSQAAMAGDFKFVDRQISSGGNVGDVASVFQDSKDVLMVNRLQHMLALIHDEQLQGALVALHADIADNPVNNSVVQEVRERQQLMLRYNMDYYHAYVMPAGQRQQLLGNGEAIAVWLLQGQHHLYSMAIPAEVIEHISSYVLGVDNHSTQKIHEAVAKKVYMGAKRRVDVKYRDSWHARLLGGRIGYPAVHEKKTAELQEIGLRSCYSSN